MEQLALHGGKPVRSSLLPYGQQWIDEEDVQAIIRVLSSSFLTQGPSIESFERKIADYVGAKYAVAFCNGTAALHGACFAAGIGPGDEVITSPFTFAASSNCVLYQGGTPVFADIDESTYLLDIQKVEEKITSRTKAIIPVDYSGQSVNMRAFQQLAKKYGLIVIQDAAHSLGATFQGEKVGKVADMTMFSFHPVKPVTTGEGGIIVTDNEEYYRKLLLFRTHGITRDLDLLVRKEEGPWYYEMVELGYNYRMTDLQAALGSSQFKKLDMFLEKRRQLAQLYDIQLQQLVNEGLIICPTIDERAQSGWHLYVVRLKVDRLQVGRREIFDALRAENIGVNVHYIPVYYHPYYQSLGYKMGTCPIAEKVYNTCLTLPLFPKMTAEDVTDVVNSLNKVLTFFKRPN